MPKITPLRKHNTGLSYQPYGNKTSHGNMEIVTETETTPVSTSAVTNTTTSSSGAGTYQKPGKEVVKSIIETVKNQEKLDAQFSSSSSSSVAQGDNKLLSRGQRKRLQRKEKVMVKIGLLQPNLKSNTSTNTSTSSSNKKELKSKNMKNDISENSFAFTLNEMMDNDGDNTPDDANPLPNQIITSNKLRKEVAIRESNRIKVVQQHPVFQENPIAAVHQHLQQLLGQQQQQQQQSSANKKPNNKKK